MRNITRQVDGRGHSKTQEENVSATKFVFTAPFTDRLPCHFSVFVSSIFVESDLEALND